MQFCDERGEVFVARLQIFRRSDAGDIPRRKAVVRFPVLHGILAVLLNDGEMGVDIVVVLRVVLVVGGRNEERVEIYALDAQRGEVVNLLLHALQIAAVKVAHIERGDGRVPVPNLFDVPARIVIFVVGDVVLGVAVEEPVGVYLIEHPALCPVGHVEPRDERKVILVLVVGDGTYAVIEHHVVVIGYLKVIADFVGADADEVEVIIIECVRALGTRLMHFVAARTYAHVHFERVVFECSES